MTDPVPAGQRVRVLPLGGAVEVARSYLRVHIRDGWSGRCQGCGEAHPCRDRQAARVVVGGRDRNPGPPGNRIAWLALPTVAGILLIVLAVTGFVP